MDDAVWRLDDFDLDGLARRRGQARRGGRDPQPRRGGARGFRGRGTRYFLMGETAMGWNDRADPCNDENYGTIARYVGPGLDGQFDLVLYHGVSYRVRVRRQRMLHADYWLQHGLVEVAAGCDRDAVYIGSHDTARFA
ncbi:MAG: hypothetical protein U0168_27580 [Nannocystaceae bacterium]